MSIHTTKIVYDGTVKTQARDLDPDQVLAVYKSKFASLSNGSYTVSVADGIKTITILAGAGVKG